MSDLAIFQQGLLPVMPSALDGREGDNRASGRCRIAAQDDRSAILAWVAARAGSSNTAASYLREADRLFRWAVFIVGKPISSLSHEDMQRYERFLSAVPNDWINKRKLPCGHPEWRPFSRQPALASIARSMAVLQAMFGWLVDARYLDHNPLALVRRQKPPRRPYFDRVLYSHQQQLLLDYIEAMPRATPREIMRYHRCRWVFSLLLLAGLRISEACNGVMGSFTHGPGGDPQRLYIEVFGKGGKHRLVPATDELIDEARLYRQSIGLPPDAAPGDMVPLIAAVYKKRREVPLARQSVHRIVKTVVSGCVAHLNSTGQEREAARLVAASAHWLRHTYATNLLDAGADLRTARDNLGHGSITTTSLYSHKDYDARHEDTAKLRLRR